MKELTRIEPEPESYDVDHTLKWMAEGKNHGLSEWQTDGVIRLLIKKLNELTDEVNRMKNEGK